ncbi:DeoR/GlpR family DNA-binding transcription regulator [Dactylosporangium sp. NPDC048998]|uniref:DeoR/GlpR family DNA-binding transcription regulator n=1 Tax=Dactylosporangium sp. NPDC048998 TaxID=3363976 RepID=UPI003720B10A
MTSQPIRMPDAQRHRHPDQRRAEILHVVNRDGGARIGDLARHFDVSCVTVLRDLRRMTRLGLLEQVRGGAVAATIPTARATWTHRAALPAHHAIARHAAALVAADAAVTITGDVMSGLLAGYLVGVPRLTVVTNSIAACTVLSRHGRQDQQLVLTGGERTRTGALAGPVAEAAARSLNVDQCFLAPYGIDERGYTAADPMEATVIRSFLAMASSVIVLADHTRWNTTGVATIGPLNCADTVIVDQGMPAAARRVLSGNTGTLVTVDHDPEGIGSLVSGR